MNWKLVKSVYSLYIQRLVGAILITLTYRRWLFLIFFSFIFLVDFFIYQVDSSDSSDNNFFLRYLLGIHIQVLPVHGLYRCCVVSRHISTCFYYKKYLNAPKNQPTNRKEDEDEENTKKATWCLLNIFSFSHRCFYIFIHKFIENMRTNKKQYHLNAYHKSKTGCCM